MTAPSGILLVDKPSGLTSHDVVRRLKASLVAECPQLQRRSGRARRAGGKQVSAPRFRCGHAGSLDPLATGLLIVLVGAGSRLSPFLMGLDKIYAATIRFGAHTDTLDREGRVLEKIAPPESPDRVAACLPAFLGDIQQVPPVVSALKRGGVALHKLVRSGQEVAPPPARPVCISRLELKGQRWQNPAGPWEVDLEVACSSGTYIRSLARDLGRAAGSAALLQELRRLAVGPFHVAHALQDPCALGGGDLLSSLLPLAEALPHLPAMVLAETETAAVRQGGQPQPEWLDRLSGPLSAAGGQGFWRLLDEAGALVAVGRLEQDSGLPRLAAVIPTENEPCA